MRSRASSKVYLTLLSLGALVFFNFTLTSSSASANETFLSHLNSLRASHGLAPLSLSGTLSSIAYNHSIQMQQAGNIFHNSSLTSQVSGWIKLGENVGMGPSVTSIDAAFDSSPEHYANEVDPAFTEVGIGYVTSTSGTIYVTLDFEEPIQQVQPAQPAQPVQQPQVQQPQQPQALSQPRVGNQNFKNSVRTSSWPSNSVSGEVKARQITPNPPNGTPLKIIPSGVHYYPFQHRDLAEGTDAPPTPTQTRVPLFNTNANAGIWKIVDVCLIALSLLMFITILVAFGY